MKKYEEDEPVRLLQFQWIKKYFSFIEVRFCMIPGWDVCCMSFGNLKKIITEGGILEENRTRTSWIKSRFKNFCWQKRKLNMNVHAPINSLSLHISSYQEKLVRLTFLWSFILSLSNPLTPSLTSILNLAHYWSSLGQTPFIYFSKFLFWTCTLSNAM